MKKDGSFSGGSVYSLHSTVTVTSTSSSSDGSILADNGSKFVQFKNRLFSLFTFLGSRSLPSKFALFSAFVEFIQVFSFAFSGPLAEGWEVEDAYFFDYIPLVRTFGAGTQAFQTHEAVFWLVFIYIACAVGLGCWISYRLHRGEEAWTRTVGLLYWMVALFEMLYLPCLSNCLGLLSCQKDKDLMYRFADEAVACSSSVSSMYFALASLTALSCMLIGFFAAALFYPCFPDKTQHMSVSTSRHRMLLWVAKTVTAILAEFAIYVPGTTLRTLVYGLAMIALLLAPLVFVIYFLPHHRFAAGHVVSALLGVCVLAGAARLVGNIGTAAQALSFYVFLGLMPVVVAVVAGVSIFRARVLSGAGGEYNEGMLPLAHPSQQQYSKPATPVSR
eukprot:TRINITY_DN2279_c0_g1_i1.p1 TRINITY_DN2279_c0_g1~~TRINITY_DN2279_c0_g1_i1.p1  ORF type:complete len:389 (-),score=91.38 TRINITY_DN2279_c0_g1_i1:173-1339(-)